MSEKSLTDSQRQRLEQRKDVLNKERQLKFEKLKELRLNYAIEVGTAIKFQLKQQIQSEETELPHLDRELDEIEQNLSLGKASDVIDIHVLVQKVRKCLHDDIQRLHGTMPLLGVDHSVDLGELFVDVNILEEVSSSRKSEINDLWQDFTTGIQQYSSYHSLDRIGLGKQQQRVSGLTVLAKNTNLMVLGKPGSGKTTFIQRIVTECNEGKLQSQRIAVLIKLREFVDDGRKFEYNLQLYLTQQWRLDEAETELVLSQGRALILLDGLDEVTGTDGREISKQIKLFVRNYPQNQLIVSCRTQSQQSRFERFDYVEVADFNESQVKAFAKHYFPAVYSDVEKGQAKAEQFIEKLFLEENQTIRELAITPILLSLTCAVFQAQGKFYSKRSKLYEEGLELLLEKWDKLREIERDEIYRDLSMERKIELLSYLAVKKFEQQQYVLFEEKEIEGYIAEFLQISRGDSRVVLRAIEAQHGLLIERAQKVWSFSHLTFQEYFASQWFIHPSNLKGLVSHITDKQWQEVFLLAVEMLDDANSLVLVKLMKIKLNEILHKSKKIQQLLTWVNKKSLQIDQSINPNYSRFHASIRAFYCANTFDHALNLNRTTDYANALAETLNPNFSLSHIFTIALDCERKFPLDYNLVLDCALTGILTLAIDINEQLSVDPNWLDTNLYLSTLASCFNDILTNKFIFCKPNSELKQSLKNLKRELPNQKSAGLLVKWWQTKGFNWTEKLRTTLIKYQDIGYDWQFNEDEIKKLQIYFEANKLLVECLDKASCDIHTTKEEIEANLLLPLNDTWQ